MAVDTGGTCAIIHAECHVLIPGALIFIKSHEDTCDTLSDLTPSLGDLTPVVRTGGLLVGRVVTDFGILVLPVSMLLLWHLPQCSHRAAKRATLVLADRPGHTRKRGTHGRLRAGPGLWGASHCPPTTSLKDAALRACVVEIFWMGYMTTPSRPLPMVGVYEDLHVCVLQPQDKPPVSVPSLPSALS